MLFILDTDPGEQQDITATNPDPVAQLEADSRTGDADNTPPGGWTRTWKTVVKTKQNGRSTGLSRWGQHAKPS